MSIDAVARVLKDNARLAELKKCQTDLFYLCSEVLDYKWNPEKQQGMTEAFHGPMCERMDRLREHPRILTLAPRKHLKTTVFTIGLAVQEILRDPDITILVPHAVEEEAIKIVAEVTDHFKSNKRLRLLEPSIMPATNGKWWYGSGRMSVRRVRFSRQPTMMACGAGSEIGGAHCSLILPDDIIGRRTIENSEMPKIKSWWQNTIIHVLDNNGRIRAVGTRWHPDDIWQDFIDSGHWDVCVRKASEIDGERDDTLQNPIHFGVEPGGFEKSIKRLERNREESKGDFDAQMMNDPSPASEKPWDRASMEHLVDKKYIEGAGTCYLVLDPAPAKIGSEDGSGEKARADGTKDFWSMAMFKNRRNGDRKEAIWVDGDQSRDWDLDEGLRRACRMMKKWGCRRIAIEAVGQVGAIYMSRMRDIAREEGVKFTPIELETTYKGKQQRFGALCAKAIGDEFLMGETVPEGIRAIFLEQAREWRKLATGRNGLKYDDMADVVSYCCDPALSSYEMSEKMQEWSPYRQPEDEEFTQGGRYVRW
jgi:hypothetical protein